MKSVHSMEGDEDVCIVSCTVLNVLRQFVYLYAIVTSSLFLREVLLCSSDWLRAHLIVQVILLPQSFKCSDYRHVPQHQFSRFFP